jgi:hypothetical protein
MFKNYGYKVNWEGLGDVYNSQFTFYVNHAMIHVLGTFFCFCCRDAVIPRMAYTCL